METIDDVPALNVKFVATVKTIGFPLSVAVLLPKFIVLTFELLENIVPAAILWFAVLKVP